MTILSSNIINHNLNIIFLDFFYNIIIFLFFQNGKIKEFEVGP